MYNLIGSVVGLWLVFLLHCHGNELPSLLHQNDIRKAIRKEVLKDYDTVIGPVKFTKEGEHATEIRFMFSVVNLVGVDTKDQTLKIDGWVLQNWKDEFLEWNATKFNDILFTVFSPDEIWVPDIALINNANKDAKLAGGREKFVTFVNAFNSGQMRWLSPASFTSTCNQDVRAWPMDTQVCYLKFASFTYFSKFLKVVSNTNFKYEKGSVSNGEWVIDEMEASNEITEHNSLGSNFSMVVYKLTLSRKPKYFLFYLAPPVIVLVLLSLMSFFIPTESGERIGFVTTILLAMMVFLNIIPNYLPKNSDEVPILGILLMVSMGIISGVLIATIFILLCHHRKGIPPLIFRKILRPFKSEKNHLDINVEVNEGLEMEITSIDNKNKSNTTTVSMPEEELPSQDQPKITWQKISRKMNWVSFSFISIVSLVAILLISLK